MITQETNEGAEERKQLKLNDNLIFVFSIQDRFGVIYESISRIMFLCFRRC